MRIFLFFLLFITGHLTAQSDALPGTYTGTYGGDQITLTLESQSNGRYPGQMKDSHQTYVVDLGKNGNQLTGSATETSLGLIFQLKGTHTDDQIQMHFTLYFQGSVSEMDILFSKAGTQSQPVTLSFSTNGPAFPADAQHPAELAGTWTQEQLYQSGYGDNSMSAGFSQSLTFLANGQLAEGGSGSYISGSNYSGQSSGGGNGVIAGAGWYTNGNQLYVILVENGQSQTHHLGKYYVEGNNMLITSPQGEKLLMQRN